MYRKNRFPAQLQFKLVIPLVLLVFLVAYPYKKAVAVALGPGNIPFWLDVRDNHQLDDQVISFLTENAAVVVLRARSHGPVDRYNLSAIVNRLHQTNPSLPVLLYTWVSRYLAGRGSGAEIMGWLARKPKLQILSLKDDPMSSFGDAMSPEYRRRAVDAITGALKQSGADGIAVDLAIRTPRFRPKPLARRCTADPEFCGQYAHGMDMLFAELSKALGKRPLLYNGLWNFGKGMPNDQLKLIKHADAAIVEYFGMNPLEKKHSFSKDILPYLKIMQGLGAEKQLFVFGRSPLTYTDYQEDYLWQRYLYCAFLLAKQKNTLFKYHASFQVPAIAGRSGGLDVYADWQLDLGEPKGFYQVKKELYVRKFEKGLVVVAPDDGRGGKLTLNTPLYTPEGKQLQGEIELNPGEGKLLLKKYSNQGAVRNAADAQSSDLLLNNWQDARVIENEGRNDSYVRLSNVTKVLEGEHDLLLSPIRSLRMPDILNLQIRLQEPNARVLLVAEVDDPRHRANSVIIELAVPRKTPLKATGTAILFRTSTPKNTRLWSNARNQPYILGPALALGQWQNLKIEGHKLLQQFQFKRWSHIRFVGAVDLMSASISSKN
jgi:hypothetical protein